MDTEFKELILKMRENRKLPHCFLFFGEEGYGKTEAAIFVSGVILEGEDVTLIEERRHPDVIWVEHTGKLGGFSIATVREVCADAYVKPNNTNSKVYIFDDADNMQATAQNALLKVMEEPPEGVYFILTAKNKTVFLETILSRVTSIGLKKPNVAENINQNVDSFFKAILSNDEYNALKAIFSVNNKDELLKFLRDTENSLTTYFDSSSCVKIYNYIRKCYRELTANTNIKLIMTNLVSDIFTR